MCLSWAPKRGLDGVSGFRECVVGAVVERLVSNKEQYQVSTP